MTPRPELLAADHIRDLVQGFTTTESVTQPTLCDDGTWRPVRRLHSVTHPALLDQVEATVTGSTTGGEVFRAAYGSKPAGRLDALALMHRIERQSDELAIEHDIDLMPLRPRLLALSGKIGHRHDRTVKSWWVTARILTQHDEPPYSPLAPCPEEDCDQLGTLRVRPEERIATCTACHRTWTEHDHDPARAFGRLVVWVKWATVHLPGPRHLVDAATAEKLTDAGDRVEHGYDEDLGYLVVCSGCEHERHARAVREVERLKANRSYERAQDARAAARRAQRVPA